MQNSSKSIFVTPTTHPTSFTSTGDTWLLQWISALLGGVDENPRKRCLKGVIRCEGWISVLWGGAWTCLSVTGVCHNTNICGNWTQKFSPCRFPLSSDTSVMEEKIQSLPQELRTLPKIKENHQNKSGTSKSKTIIRTLITVIEFLSTTLWHTIWRNSGGCTDSWVTFQTKMSKNNLFMIEKTRTKKVKVPRDRIVVYLQMYKQDERTNKVKPRESLKKITVKVQEPPSPTLWKQNTPW